MFKDYFELVETFVEYYTKGVGVSTPALNRKLIADDQQILDTASIHHNVLIDENGTEIKIGYLDSLRATDILWVMTIFANFVFAKKLMTQRVEKSTFLDKVVGMRPKDKNRLSECLWRLLFYSVSSCWLTYSCFVRRRTKIFSNESFSKYQVSIETDEYLISMLEVGFYLHATYSTLYEDIWRRDSRLVLIHHVAAFFSLFTIYITKAHKIGLATLFLRDTCDVILEITKFSMCFRIQHGHVIKFYENCVKFFMTLLAVVFVINQLYYYPLVCLYHMINFIRVNNLNSPIWVGIVTCGWLFLLIDLFWFMIILRILYRMYLIRAPLKDITEYDEDESEGDNQKSREHSAKTLRFHSLTEKARKSD